jgi:hypothetical protein
MTALRSAGGNGCLLSEALGLVSGNFHHEGTKNTKNARRNAIHHRGTENTEAAIHRGRFDGRPAQQAG